MEFVDPGENRDLLLRARASGVVLDYSIVASDEDLGDSEILRRVVLFTARGLCVVRRLSPGPEIDPSSIPGNRIIEDEFHGWGVYRRARRLLMQGGAPDREIPPDTKWESRTGSESFTSEPRGSGPTIRMNRSTTNALAIRATGAPSSALRTTSRCCPEPFRIFSLRSMTVCRSIRTPRRRSGSSNRGGTRRRLVPILRVELVGILHVDGLYRAA